MSKNNRNRTQFRGNITAPASFEETTVDKFEEETDPVVKEPTEVIEVPVEEPEVIVDERELEDDVKLDQDYEEIEDEFEETHEDPVESEVTTPVEPAFPFTDVNTWTLEELETYISRPETMDIYHSKLVQAINAHRVLKTDLHEAWSVDECTAFFKEGTTPVKTSTGCYLRDVTRCKRREGSWTTQELEAWALGEIKPEGLVTANGLAIELHSRFNMEINTVAVESVIIHYKHKYGPNKGTVKLVGEAPAVKSFVNEPIVVTETAPKKILPGLNEMNQSYIEEGLKRYCEAVKPNRIIPQKRGEEAQRELHNILMSILKLTDPVAVKSGLDILFTKIVEERIHNPQGVFSDTNIFRFAEGVSVIGNAQEIHRRLFTLFFAFIDGDESILAQTDVPSLLKYLPSSQQNQLLGYLGRN